MQTAAGHTFPNDPSGQCIGMRNPKLPAECGEHMISFTVPSFLMHTAENELRDVTTLWQEGRVV